MIRRALLIVLLLVLAAGPAHAATPPQPPPAEAELWEGFRERTIIAPRMERVLRPRPRRLRTRRTLNVRLSLDRQARRLRRSGTRHRRRGRTLTIYDARGRVTSRYRQLSRNRYAVVMRSPPNAHKSSAGDECVEAKHSYFTGPWGDYENTWPAASGWGWSDQSLFANVPRWDATPARFTVRYNSATFRRDFGGVDPMYYAWNAHENSVGRAANRCNWFGNDPNGNGAGATMRAYSGVTWGGDTTQSGLVDPYGGGTQPQFELWNGYGDGQNTIESYPGRSNGSGGQAAILVSGSVYDANWQTWRPRIIEADYAINGNERFAGSDELYYIFTHETLHTYGAGHANDWTGGSPGTGHTPDKTSFMTMSYCMCVLHHSEGAWPFRPGKADSAFLGLGDQYVVNSSYFGWPSN